MSAKITIEFSGSLQEFIGFVENTFKDPVMLTVHASAEYDAVKNQTATKLYDLAVSLYKACFRYDLTGQDLAIRDNIQFLNLLNAMPEIIRHVKAGNKINAIKDVRQAVNCGLKEAKDAIESHELSLRAEALLSGSVNGVGRTAFE